jgi:hypothetical protein
MKYLYTILLLCCLASATTRYVAQSAGTFSGGTACNGQTAITVATFNGLTLSAGDLTWVCGTVTISGNGSTGINFGSNTGSPGNLLVLRFDTNAVIVCATYCGSASGGASAGAITLGSGNSYITIDGNNLTGTVANGLNGSSTGACYLGTCTTQQASTLISFWAANHIVVQNLNVIDAYVNVAGDSTISDSSSVQPFQYSGSNITISGNVVHDFGWWENFFRNGDTNIQVYNNVVSSFAHGYALATSTASAGVSNVYIHDNHYSPNANWTATGCFAHVNALHGYGTTGTSINNLFWYNNLFDGNPGACVDGAVFIEGGGSSTPSHLQNGYFFNNVINASSGPTNLTAGWMGIYAGDSGVQYFMNNTIVCPSGTDSSLGAGFSGENGHTSMAALTFANNAITPCGNPIAIGISGYGATLASAGGVTEGSDYNFLGPYAASNAFVWQSTSENTFPAWQSASSADSHSVAYFAGTVNTSGTGVTWTAGTPFVSAMAGEHIVINGVTYTVSTFNSVSSLTLTGSAGTQTGVVYQQPGPTDVSSSGVPSTGSPTISAGINLYTLAGCNSLTLPGLGALCSDTTAGNTRTANARPSSGAWDIGAYQYQSSAPPPAPFPMLAQAH